MSKNIKDFIHLYLGCDVFDARDGETYDLDGNVLTNFLEVKDGIFSRIKPILRKLSDMTKEERSQYLSYWDAEIVGSRTEYATKRDAEATRYLLSKHFDLFGLIESGLAIDKTTLK